MYRALGDANIYKRSTAEGFIIEIAWLADGDGSVTLNDFLDCGCSGFVWMLKTVPGTVTDNYDITIEDTNGYDMLEGLGANRDTANVETQYLAENTSETIATVPKLEAGMYYFKVTNAGASGYGTTTIEFRRQ